MREIRRSALIPATAQRMFALINDVESYPKFIQGCSAATVLERSADTLRARLTVGSGALRTSFITRNRLTPHSAIDMTLEEGPFRSLDGRWTLTPVTEPDTAKQIGCRVELDLRFELKGSLADLALGPAIERIAGSLVAAFVERVRAGEP